MDGDEQTQDASPVQLVKQDEDTQAQDSSSVQPRYGSTNATPAEGSLRSAILDVELAGGNRREALSSSANAIYSSRSSITRDILNIAITVLIGAMALYSAAPMLVKSPVLFFISTAVLLVCAVLCLATRLQLNDYLQSATTAIENYYTNLVQAASAFKLSVDDENLRKFKNADEADLSLPRLRWFARNGPSLVVVTFLMGIIGVGLSLLFVITT